MMIIVTIIINLIQKMSMITIVIMMIQLHLSRVIPTWIYIKLIILILLMISKICNVSMNSNKIMIIIKTHLKFLLYSPIYSLIWI